MGLISWLGNLWKTDSDDTENITTTASVVDTANTAFLKKLAIDSCVNIISRTISCCEFLTFEDGVEQRDKMYYKLNVEPNQNQTSSKFWQDVVARLVHTNECLVIEYDDDYIVADSFTKSENAFEANTYSEVKIKNKVLRESFIEKEVWHFELNNSDIKKVVESMHSSFNKLLKSLQSSAQGDKKYTLEIPAQYPQTPQAQAELTELLEENMRAFLTSGKNAVLPLNHGLKLTDMSGKDVDKATKSYLEIADATFKFTATGFGIPRKLITGEVADTDEVVNNLITFTIKPFAQIITDEVNRKTYGRAAYLNRTYTKLDTTRIKHVDITQIAGALDILTRIGAYSVNDCLRILGKEEIQEAWANERYVTKNYEKVERKGEKGA